jgi:hypothetical protein
MLWQKGLHLNLESVYNSDKCEVPSCYYAILFKGLYGKVLYGNV